ncbi:MAG: carbohydrate kinase family protein [Patescibacteria group bacterium]
MGTIDFLAIGDITTDTFIKLKEAEVHCDINTDACTISMRWGDKIPYESATVISGVGNAANAAVSAARLGLSVGMLTSTGTDYLGEENIAVLTHEGIDTSLVIRNEGMTSNNDYVLWYGVERTILVKHDFFPYSFPADLSAPKYIYLSSLGDPSGKSHLNLASWLTNHPETKLFFQPGQEIRMGKELLAPVYARSYLCVCNKEEAERILGYKEPQEMAILLNGMHALGPEIVLITDGPQGIHALENGVVSHVPMYPDPKPPLQRTGAGDAFASTTAVYLTLGMPLKDAMVRGTINSAYVVQQIGAQRGLLTKDALEKLANP